MRYKLRDCRQSARVEASMTFGDALKSAIVVSSDPNRTYMQVSTMVRDLEVFWTASVVRDGEGEECVEGMEGGKGRKDRSCESKHVRRKS